MSTAMGRMEAGVNQPLTAQAVKHVVVLDAPILDHLVRTALDAASLRARV
jgi:hypothetical protein